MWQPWVARSCITFKMKLLGKGHLPAELILGQLGTLQATAMWLMKVPENHQHEARGAPKPPFRRESHDVWDWKGLHASYMDLSKGNCGGRIRGHRNCTWRFPPNKCVVSASCSTSVIRAIVFGHTKNLSRSPLCPNKHLQFSTL